MSKQSQRLKRIEKRVNPDSYRKRYFIPWDRREPLTAEEWVDLVDLHEKAHRLFREHLVSSGGRLLSQEELEKLQSDYEETGDLEKLQSVLSDPNLFVDDSAAFDFLEGQESARATELLTRYFRHHVSMDPLNTSLKERNDNATE